MAIKTPAVDVIIPTYNGLPYLKETVESVLNQTYKNFNLYIIDDGSTDNGATEKFIKNLSDKRVVYKRKKNGGQATARNYGIQISTSPYLAFVDSDDLWLPEKLTEQVKLLDKDPGIGLVYGYHHVLNEHGKIAGEVKHNEEGDLYKSLLGGNKISGSASMVMVRREVFDKVGLFREDFLIGEDWEMWLRIARDYKIGCVHKYLAQLRALPEGMQKNYLKMARGLDYMLPILIDEFKPGLIDKARLYGTCLWDATNYYYVGQEFDSAQKDFFKLILHNPFKLKFGRVYWYMYARLLLRSKTLRGLRRVLSPAYRRREKEFLKEQKQIVALDKKK